MNTDCACDWTYYDIIGTLNVDLNKSLVELKMVSVTALWRDKLLYNMLKNN